MNFIWTDELVLELLRLKIGTETEMSVVSEFKNSKSLLPTNAIIHSVFDDDGDEMPAEKLTIDFLYKRINHDSYTIAPIIKACECNGAIFSVGDIVYNNIAYKKYGGKWSNYAVKIESLDLRVRKSDDKVISSLLLINNFYEVNNFIKK